MHCRERLRTRGSFLGQKRSYKPLNLFLPRRAVGSGIGSSLNFSCFEKDWPKELILDGEAVWKGNMMKKQGIRILWAHTVQFELKCSLKKKHNEKRRGIFKSSVILSTQ